MVTQKNKEETKEQVINESQNAGMKLQSWKQNLFMFYRTAKLQNWGVPFLLDKKKDLNCITV